MTLLRKFLHYLIFTPEGRKKGAAEIIFIALFLYIDLWHAQTMSDIFWGILLWAVIPIVISFFVWKFFVHDKQNEPDIASVS